MTTPSLASISLVVANTGAWVEAQMGSSRSLCLIRPLGWQSRSKELRRHYVLSAAERALADFAPIHLTASEYAALHADQLTRILEVLGLNHRGESHEQI